MKFKNLLLAAAILFSCGIFAQDLFPPTEIIQGTFLGKTGNLRDFPLMEGNFNDPRTLTVFPNESNTTPQNNSSEPTVINNIQTVEGGIFSYALEQNFIGASSTESGAYPPDPTGAVGPNHYVHSVNSLVKIFDKVGTLLVGPVSLGAFLGIGSNSGDPIVLYDQLADRWVVSEFGSINNSLAIGVSETNDPTGAYNVYQFVFNGFPDYPKYSVWPDGYYGTVNLNGQTTRAFAMERDVMLAGGANPEIVIFSLPGVVINPNQVKSPEAANLLGLNSPANVPGYITYLQDNAWGGVSFDHLKIWEIEMDWNNTGNSTISSPLEIPTDPFDAGEIFGQGAVDQPGTNQKLAAHGGIISFAANYRTFADHNSWLITFNTFIDNNDTGGIRWIELRNDDVNPWAIYQEGTYAVADGHSRFMSSSAMDASGNIGLGFSIGSSTLPVGIRYTGRFDGDPLGQMTVAETTIVDGVGVRNNSYRYGDYGHLTMDPDNFTFWYTADFFFANNAWRTQIASFSLSGGFTDDVGISDIVNPTNGTLTNTETVEVSIRNFGTDSQTNIPVELRVDGNLVATETFLGTVAPNDTANFTFTQTVDLSTEGQTYTIEAKTVFAGDEFEPNDTFSKDVTHLLGNDIGITAITNPTPVNPLGNEIVTVIIKNYGANTQSNFDVQYTVNGGTPEIQTVAGPLSSEEEMSFNFTQQVDLTSSGVYEIVAKTNLAGDQETSNDEYTQTTFAGCIPTSTSGCNLDGIKKFVLGSIDVDDGGNGCNTEPASSPQGYADRTYLSTTLSNLPGNNVYTLQAQQNWSPDTNPPFTPGDEGFAVWIDFDDSGTFDPNELLIDSAFQTSVALESFTLTIPEGAALGSHILRAKAIDITGGDDLTNPCEDFSYGEVHDYTVVIVDVLSTDDIAINDSELIISSTDNNNFDVNLSTTYDGQVYLTLYNMLGQELGFKSLQKVGNNYSIKLDLSSVASGIYLIKVSGQTTKTFKTGRIIVN
jgi:hypothetical protein